MLIGDKYFKKHTEKVLGTQTEGKGRFGNTIIVKGTLADLRRIPTEPIKANKLNFKKLASVHTSKKVQQRTVTAEKEQAFADRVKLPTKDNQEVLHNISYGSEHWRIYNSQITRKELEAYLYAHPEFDHKKLVSSFKHSQESLIQEGLLFYLNGKFQYRYEYITGNLAQKLARIRKDGADYEDILLAYGDVVLENQERTLLKYLPRGKKFTNNNETITLLPHARLASFFTINRIKSGLIERPKGTGEKNWIPVEAASLNEAFRYYLNSIIDPREIKKSTKGNIVEYYLNNKTESISQQLTKEERERQEVSRSEIKKHAKAEGDRIFHQFILEELLAPDRIKLEAMWNERYNSFRVLSEQLPEGYEATSKIPVAFSQSRYFGKEKGGKRMPLRLSDTQRNGVARAASNSVLLGYGVGLGKTLTDILAISQMIELGVSKRPLIVVPNNVYYKWRKEIVGETDAEENFFVGALGHMPPIRDLYNLSNTIIRDLKTYTTSEQKELVALDRAIDLLSEEEGVVKKKASLSERLQNPKVNAYATDAIRIYADLEARENASVAKIKFDLKNEIAKLENQQQKPLDDTQKKKFKKEEEEILQEAGFLVKVNNKLVAVTKEELFVKNYKKFLNAELDYKVASGGTAKPVPPGTISMLTYEGLAKVGIKNSNHIVDKLYNILTQGNSLDDERESAKIFEIMQQLVKSNHQHAKLYVDDLEIDSVHVDEVHMAKNIFDHVKGEPTFEYEKDTVGNTLYDKQGEPVRVQVKNDNGDMKRDRSFYELKGATSKRALLTYMLIHYLQEQNENRGVIGLSATPFNNSPLEIYSMLSLINHKVLEDAGFTGLKEFFDTFMRIETDIVIDSKNKIKKDTVLKGFYNLAQLRQIILSVIDYRTNEQAGTNKPLELVYPSIAHGLKTRMVMSPLQTELMSQIELFMDSLEEINIADSFLQEDGLARDFLPEECLDFLPPESKRKYKEIPDYMSGVAILMGLSKMKSLVLSPLHFVIKEAGLKLKDLYPLTTRSTVKPKFTANLLVETSPKLTYIMGCLKSTIEYSRKHKLPQSGQIIYSTNGTDLYPILRDYMTLPENGFGLQKKEIEIITGKTTPASKERIKREFNEGKVKVLLGSKSIQVGVDLQVNTSNLFMLDFDWNPTDDEQVRGRHARQGNRHNWVRTVYAMLENSVDPIIFQYLLEKASRIKEIWDLDSNADDVDLSGIDFEALKDELITDPHKRAQIEILREKETFLEVDILLKNQINQVKEAPQLLKDFEAKFKDFYDIAEMWLLAESEHGKGAIELKAEEDIDKASKRERGWDIRRKDLKKQLQDESDLKQKKKLHLSLQEAEEKIVFQQEKQEKIKQDTKKRLREFSEKIEDYWAILRVGFDSDPTSEHNQKVFDLKARVQAFLANPPQRAVDYGRIYYRREHYRDKLDNFGIIAKRFALVKQNVLNQLGYTMDELPLIVENLEKKLEENNKAIDQLMASIDVRFQRIKTEMEANKENYRSAADRIKEFEKTNFLLHEKFPKKPSAIALGEKAIPKRKTQDTEKAKAEARMRMRVRILKLKKTEKLAA